MSALMEVKEVTKLFRNGRGVRDVSFDVAEGDIFGFIGPNGAGKTTVMKIAVGLARPDRGDVRLFGISVQDRFEQAIRHVGCIIETADAYEYMTGYDNLKLAARFYPDLPATRIDQVLEQVGLTPYKHEQVNCYSLALKQRLALASALLSRPRLVVLDEPGNGLDVEGMVDFRNIVMRLAREEGVAFLISSHMIHDLGMIANRIGIMHNGMLIRHGYAAELLEKGMSLEQYVVSQIQAAKEANRDE